MTDEEFMMTLKDLPRDEQIAKMNEYFDKKAADADKTLIGVGDAHFVEYLRPDGATRNQIIYTTDKVMLTRTGDYRLWSVNLDAESTYNRAIQSMHRLRWSRTRSCDVKFTMTDRELLTDQQVSPPLVRRVFRALE